MTVEVRNEAVLSDGTRIDDLFDLDGRRIVGSVFCDSEIYQLELSRVFRKSWLFVGLESEIAAQGDFVTRKMGGDSVIMSRDAQGKVNVFLNRCAHRGVQLCVMDTGNVKHFQCPYHGWIYDASGRLQALVAQRDWLGPDGKKDDYQIRRARVTSYGGLVFANWDHDSPSFEESLGDFRWYLDILFKALDQDLTVTGPPQRWTANFNWKLGAENFIGDSYHTPTAHGSSAILAGVEADVMLRLIYGVTGCDPTWGHGFWCFVDNGNNGFGVEKSWLRPSALKWMPPSVTPEFERHLTQGQVKLLRFGIPPSIGGLFPNFSWNAKPDYFFIRTWAPTAPGRTEILTWTLVHPDADEEVRRRADQSLNRSFGLTGMLDQDDMVLWTRVQRALEGPVAREEFHHYHCSREPNSNHILPDGSDWPGPCEIRSGFGTDDHLWNFHLRWLELMTGP